MYQNLMQGKAFNPFGCNDVPEYRSDHLDASKVKTLWSPTREASIAHNTLSWLGALPPLQKAFMPSVGQSASERLSSSPPSMFGDQTLLDGSAIYRWEQTQDPTSMVRYFKGSNGLLLISCKANMLGIGRCNSTLLVQTQRIRTEQRQCSHLLYRLFHASATNIEYTAVRLKLLAASSSRCRSKNYEKHRKLWHSHY